MQELIGKSIGDISNALRRGETTSEQLVQAYLARVERLDKKGPALNAVIHVNARALEQAKRLDELRKQGRVLSPLHGIPLAVKDNFDTADMPTTAGSAALAGSRPARDAFVIDRLRQAGAIILLKTNLSEFARNGLTLGSLIGQTRNPYDLRRTPGGSSGGTGAALAADMAAAGLGSDSANSVRSPASATGLVGLRPTTGLLSRSGIVPCSTTQDTAGPMAKYVSDAALLLDICAGYDSRDKKTAEQIGRRPDRPYTAFLDRDGLRGKRIGLLTNIFGSDRDVLAAMDDALDRMRSLGTTIVPLNAPELDSGRVFAECDVQFFELGPLLDQYFSAVPHCPVRDVKQLAASGKLSAPLQDEISRCAVLENPLEQAAYQARLRRAQAVREFTYDLMAKNHLDALCYPHQQIVAELISSGTQNGRNGILASVLGFPAITLPAGTSAPNGDAPAGVPIGIEFMARPYAEPTLLQIAYSLEQAYDHRPVPPLD